MRLSISSLFALCLIAVPASVLAKGAAPKVDVCHWQGGNDAFAVINISSNAQASHFANHDNGAGLFDHGAATFYADVDGDGFGDPTGATDDCLNAGFVDNAGDCDDGDAAVNPAAEEVCGDDIDNNCSGEIDEGCNTCPCFTAEQISGRWAEWQSDSWDWSWAGCYDVQSYYYYDYVQVYFYGERWDDAEYEYDYNDFYSIDYDYYYGSYCQSYEYDYTYNYDTGATEYTYDYYYEYITDEENESCQALLLDWSADNGLSCTVF